MFGEINQSSSAVFVEPTSSKRNADGSGKVGKVLNILSKVEWRRRLSSNI
jgi:hypothetical protein